MSTENKEPITHDLLAKLNDYKQAYRSMVDLRSEFATKDGYIREKQPDELAYHNAKSAFGEFRPEHRSVMEENTNNGKGVSVKLPDGNRDQIHNQAQLYDKITAFNRERGAFYDEKYIQETSPSDHKRMVDANNVLRETKESVVLNSASKNQAFQVLKDIENEVKADVKKQKESSKPQQQSNSTQQSEPVKSETAEQKTTEANNKVNSAKLQENSPKEKTDPNLDKERAIEAEKIAKGENKPIPEDINKRFLIDGNQEKARYFYKEKPDIEAFRDKGKKLVTNSSATMIASSMVALADSKKWESIKVTGEKKFRREVWLEASAKGIDVKGYKPTEQDLAELEKRQNKVEKDVANKDVKATGQEQASKQPTQTNASTAVNTQTTNEKVSPGKITDKDILNRSREAWKEEKLDNAPNGIEQDSSNENISINERSKAQWQKEKALSSTPQGQEVKPEALTSVSAVVAAQEAENKKVERKQALEKAFTTLEKSEAIKKHPELSPMYALDKAAQQFVNDPKHSNKFTEQGKDRFVSNVRDKAFDMVASGQKLPDVSAQKQPLRAVETEVEASR